MKCNNAACLFNLGQIEDVVIERHQDGYEHTFPGYVGECTSECHNIEPSKAALNRCPKFIAEGIQQEDEFSPWFGIDPFMGYLLDRDENKQYFKDISYIRDIMHNRTL